MDARNDDSSAGSDSLDKSLQCKCVMDDVGQGEGKKQEQNNVTAATTASTAEHCSANLHRTALNKTENAVGDGREGGGSCDIAAAAATTQIESTANTTITNISNDASITDKTEDRNESCAVSLNHLDSSSCNSNNNNNNNNNNNSSFETKVKQISKDLKETTLAEYNATCSAARTSISSSSSSCSSSTSLAAGGSEPFDQNGQLSQTESADDNRSKKVRFHPDVKENDGGNRVKKRKKKSNASDGEECNNIAGSSTRTTGIDDDEMDYEEEEEEVVEEEEEFNLAKTIVEAQNYLKLHPLTFVRASIDKSSTTHPENASTRLQNGLLQEEDLPLLSESSEEEDYHEEMQPECGVERILGKQIKNGKAELLVRFVNENGLFWESEDRIKVMCPNMINQYELNRERRQERLMRHVAKRQNLRQRYTDF